MYSFLCASQPRSINARGKEAYYDRIQNDFLNSIVGEFELLDEKLYGIVYYFYKKDINIDADNLSKPIWDALQEIIYDDDKIIQYRIAGKVPIESDDFAEIDLTNFPIGLELAFYEMIDSEDHILYIEVGRLDYKMFEFGFEAKDEN